MHRYFGKSTPFGEEKSKKRLEFCTIDQALADYAELILALKSELVCGTYHWLSHTSGTNSLSCQPIRFDGMVSLQHLAIHSILSFWPNRMPPTRL